MRKCKVLLFALICCLLTLSTVYAEMKGDTEIAYVQSLSISLLDDELSGGTFGDWLSSMAGDGTNIRWDLNDCGEQTGDPKIDHTRNLPVCVGAAVSLGTETEVYIIVLVGTIEKGTQGTPAIYGIFVTQSGRVYAAERLSQLGDFLKQIRRS